MILKIDGDLKPYYAQTLCMMFFPGVHFPENEISAPDVPQASFRLHREGDTVCASVALCFDGREEQAASSCRIGGDISAEKANQIAAGAAFFRAASALTGSRPPWGMLTGVRPAKIASAFLSEGDSPENAAARISERYLTLPHKAKLAADVAAAERRLITPELVRTCSVYIGIPFCPSRCSYCSFVSYTSQKLLSLLPEYLTALRNNIRTVFAMPRMLGIPVSSVYIGGGTPTVLDESQLAFLLDAICEETDTASLKEFTLEAGRPDTISAEKLSIARDAGVTRVSVNTQTLNDEILTAIGRRHTAKQFFHAYDLTRSSGILQINVDLIAGLPGESVESFSRTVDRIAELEPDNVTVHTFSVKKAAEIRQTGNPYDREGAAAAASVDYARDVLCARGYAPYYMYRQKNTVGNLENVGYALPGTEGLYNIYMMEEVHSIFAAGASAVTKLVSPRDERGENHIDRIFEAKYPYEYLKSYAGAAQEERAQQYRRAVADFYNTYF
ncbi:MAG: coproporphyrinogen dehydrogenase HemZ [Eubacteriales bacterium]